MKSINNDYHEAGSKITTVTSLHHRSEENINDLQCTSLLPSASEKKSTKDSSWTGWKPLSNDSSPQTNKENKEFPPLSNGNIFDSWLV